MTDDHGHDHAHDGTEEATTPAELVTQFRADKDEWMRHDPSSPLPDDQRASFTGLPYYPYDDRYLLVLPLDRDVSTDPVDMDTSTGDARPYHRLGKIQFEAEGNPAELTIYQSGDDDLFLPLRDATSGHETYGAGRYLEPDLLDDGRVLVDFNQLYNPFCAYNQNYSCPLPPVENWLRIPIRAGEKYEPHQT